MAELYFEQGRLAEALAVCAALQRFYPAFPESYSIAARIHQRLSQPRQAADTVALGLRYNPGAPDLVRLRDALRTGRATTPS